MKKWVWFAAVFALVFVLAACGGNGNNGADNGAGNVATDETGNAGNAGNAGGAVSTSLTVKAKNWAFDQAEYHIPKGTDVTLSLESTEGVHGVAIRDTDYNVANGASATINIAEAGEYELYCSVPCGTGHSQMKSKLIVE